jgi:hypothetical protein
MRSDSYDMLGDVSSKVLALLDLHEHEQAATTPAAAAAPLPQSWQQQQQQHALLQDELSSERNSSSVGLHASAAASLPGSRAAAVGGFAGLEGLDLAGVQWQRPAQQQQQPGSWLPLSPSAAANTRSEACQQQQVLAGSSNSGTVPTAAASAGGGGIWGSALGLGLGLDSSTGLPPLAPKGQPLQLAAQRLGRMHRSNTEDGGSSSLDEQFGLAGRQLRGSLEFPVSGRLSPLVPADDGAGSALHGFTQQQQQQQHAALLLGQQLSPSQQQQHLNALLQLSGGGDYIGDYSMAAGDLALLSRSSSSSSAPSLGALGAGLAGIGASSRLGWGAAAAQQQQQQQLSTQPAAGVVAAAAAAAAAAAMSGVHLQQQQQHLQFLQAQQQQQQQLQLLQLQQQLQLQGQQQAAAALSAGALLGQHNLNAFSTAGLGIVDHGLQPSQLSPAAAATAAAGAGALSGMLLPSSSAGMAAQGVGQFSSSFAFGAPGLSAFAPLAAATPSSSGSAAAFGNRSL